ncbi:hypothetical protein U3516DRAFT_666657 [Neocallimastix sp. 'constans']
MMNGLFIQSCPHKATTFLTLVYFIEFTVVFINISKYPIISNGRYIFIESRFISNISILWLFIDPGFNLILVNLFTEDDIAFQNIRFYTNIICNNRCSYFLSVPGAKCIIHNSYSCRCAKKRIETYDENELQSIDEYINFINKFFSVKYILNIIKIKFERQFSKE